jgi:hypothetical protein
MPDGIPLIGDVIKPPSAMEILKTQATALTLKDMIRERKIQQRVSTGIQEEKELALKRQRVMQEAEQFVPTVPETIKKPELRTLAEETRLERLEPFEKRMKLLGQPRTNIDIEKEVREQEGDIAGLRGLETQQRTQALQVIQAGLGFAKAGQTDLANTLLQGNSRQILSALPNIAVDGEIPLLTEVVDAGDRVVIKSNKGVGLLNKKDNTFEFSKFPTEPGTEQDEIIQTEKTGKTGQNFLLPNGQIVLSFDGGRTFKDVEGITQSIPSNAVKVPTGATLTEIQAQQAKEKAEAEIKDVKVKKLTEKDVQEAALGGTGPFASFKAAMDRFFGGLGADLIFGKEGLFPDTQKNRQVLRLVRQTGKAGLLNSSRGAIWEQQNINELFADPDVFFTNPRTEAGKFELLRNTLITERALNNQAILTGTPKEIEKLRQSNLEINKTLAVLGEGTPVEETPILSPGDEALINKYLR